MGRWGPFLSVAAMVVAVLMPVVFCGKATEKCNIYTKICCLLSMLEFITMYFKTYYNSRNANCSMARA